MIRYALACAKGHAFESWFPSSAAYDKQAKRGLVACPVCGDSKVEKAIMAPKLSGTRKRGKASPPVAASDAPAPNATTAPVAMVSPQEHELRQKLKELREHLTQNADYVGTKFPEEARKIFYRESPGRAIRGQATKDEHDSLVDEGIPVARFPVPPRERLN